MHTAAKRSTDPPPVIFLSGNATMGGEEGQFPPVNMRAGCMLHGPFNHDPTELNLAILSLGNCARKLHLSLQAKLHMLNLVIKDLVSLPLSYLGQGFQDSDYITALPLWGFNIALCELNPVWLDSCALLVPPDD